MIETQFNHTIKIFRLDNAQEYNDKSFLSFLDSNGALPHQSCPYICQQNGPAEWKHRHILDVVRAFLIFSSILECFWGEATLAAIYTINHIHSPTTHNKSPFELLYGQTLDCSSLRVFGCACFVSLPHHEWTKLQCSSLVLLRIWCIPKGILLLWFHNSLPSCLPSCWVLGTLSFHESSVISYVLFLRVSHFY